MADSSVVMSQAEVYALKETLCAQQQLLQKLYNELDEEREASATAVSEALSMILRLQGEKAAVKMEAEQYKRFSEEKICHAEESLAIIEDIIYQKEMEVAALDYQVQAYRYKLLSMGCVDPGVGEIKFPENLLQRNETLAGESSIQNLGSRNYVPHLLKYKKVVREKESSMSKETDLNGKIMEEHNNKSSDSDRRIDNATPGTPGHINSYWEQIRKLDVRVKEIAGGNNTNFKNEMRSPSSISSRPSTGFLWDPSGLRNETLSPSLQLSTGNGCGTNKVCVENEIDPIKRPTDLPKKSVAVDYSCPPSVHDVFEVPQVDENLRSCESSTKDRRMMLHHGSESLESDGYPGHSKLCNKDELDWLKKLLQSNHRENKLCKPSEIADIDCRLSIVQTSTNVSESLPRSNQFNMRSEITEIERPSAPTNREEEINLLKEIKEKLNSLHDEIRSTKFKKQHAQDDPSFYLLAEAMIYFWL